MSSRIRSNVGRQTCLWRGQWMYGVAGIDLSRELNGGNKGTIADVAPLETTQIFERSVY